jgi:hypothetical protein
MKLMYLGHKVCRQIRGQLLHIRYNSNSREWNRFFPESWCTGISVCPF